MSKRHTAGSIKLCGKVVINRMTPHVFVTSCAERPGQRRDCSRRNVDGANRMVPTVCDIERPETGRVREPARRLKARICAEPICHSTRRKRGGVAREDGGPRAGHDAHGVGARVGHEDRIAVHSDTLGRSKLGGHGRERTVLQVTVRPATSERERRRLRVRARALEGHGGCRAARGEEKEGEEERAHPPRNSTCHVREGVERAGRNGGFGAMRAP